jgi:hypothetical protein
MTTSEAPAATLSSDADSPATDKEHVCKVTDCGKSFDTARQLASHLKAHSAGTLCPLCQKPVRYLAPHLRREHADDDLVRLERMIAELVDEVRAFRARIPRNQGL